LVRWFQSYFLILVLFPLYAGAVARDLGDCTVGGTPTAIAPLDLDNCTISDGDDITGILTDLASTYADVYVKAPSVSKSVTFTGTVQFGPSGMGADEFKFFEDESATLSIQHVPVTEDATMWRMTNLDAITIGGAGLRMTLRGTHPGLGTFKPCTGSLEACTVETQTGLIDIELTDASNPALADIRANFWTTWSAGVMFVGGSTGASGEATANRWQQVNIAGTHVGAGAIFNSGVQDLWFDPDRTVFMDPWNRFQGWDGGLAKTDSGRDVGCSDTARQMYRNPAGPSGNYMRRVSGAVTLEYGLPHANFFAVKYLGNSATDRFLVRTKDMGASGPTSITGLPAGVAVKTGVTHGIMKNDPMPLYTGITGADSRWLAFQQLPSTYGDGTYGATIADGLCETGTSSNNFNSGTPWIWFAEASSDTLASQYVNAYQDVRFTGTFDWDFANSTREYIRGQGAPDKHICCAADRTYGHVLTMASGASVTGIATMLDTMTLTGPGTWANINIARVQIDSGSDAYVNPNDNTVTDTRVSGVIAVGQDATGTVISNVDFTGSLRAVITIGASSAVTVTDLCVPNGSTITGSGTLTYEGSSQSLPFTIPDGTTNCSITTEGRPNPPSGGSVN
jgi:hypothetical protein